ncbi:P-loop containing nucleoside triphosphate hydrolase [Sesbania bispinosa]|nr:P-loop containing nucleoside triphosphate hydrolase [Sesbania bispinosa]
MAPEDTVTSNPSHGERPKVVVITGPTGSGKSKLAVDLASHFPVEVINADSMQVYRGLDVLTNKHPLSDQNGVPHHLLGTVNPDVEFTAKAFRDSAIPIIDAILARNHLPVIVGGTNYYIQALVSPFLLDDSADDMKESCLGDPPGQKWGQVDSLRYDCCFICVDASLPVLDRYVDHRVDCMIDAGLLNEVYNIYNLHADYSRGLRQAIGVREFELLLRTFVVENISKREKELTERSSIEKHETLFNGNVMEWLRSSSDTKSIILLEEAIEKVKLNTRRLVRRQICKETESKSDDVWRGQVVESAKKIIKTFLSEDGSLSSTFGMSNDTGMKLNQRDLWTQYICKACGDRVLRGLHEWEQHRRGRGHRKRISRIKSKEQGHGFVEQKLEYSECKTANS